jgi:hypothetical protein
MTCDRIRRMTFRTGPLIIDIGGGAPYRALAWVRGHVYRPSRNGKRQGK